MGRLGRMLVVAFIYIGTVVGAGFASGQEIWFFFSRYRGYGTLGLLLSGVAFAFLGVKAMEWGRRIETGSYRDFFTAIIGRQYAFFCDIMLTVFLLVLTGIMLAGAGAVTAAFGWGWAVGTWAAVIGAMVALIKPLTGLKGVNSLVVPLLCLTGWLLHLGKTGVAAPLAPGGWPGGWFLAALQYSAYNLILALPVLVTLYRLEPDPAVLVGGGLVGGVGLGILACLFHLVLKEFDFAAIDLPILFLTRRWRWGWPFFYSFVLWGELFTSLVANLYGLVSRFHLEEDRFYLWKLAFVLLLAVVVSRFGFARLLQKVYPFFGCFALTILLPLALRPLPPAKKEADKARKRRFFDRRKDDINKRERLL
ncbi:MAG: hypothetical protein GX202_08870 [Firmicutes bacterium]|nr:hypothetical protein [Bacillota bacterium]